MRLRTLYPLCLALLCLILASGLSGCHPHDRGPSRPADPPKHTQKAPPPKHEQPGPKNSPPSQKPHPAPQPERNGGGPRR